MRTRPAGSEKREVRGEELVDDAERDDLSGAVGEVGGDTDARNGSGSGAAAGGWRRPSRGGVSSAGVAREGLGNRWPPPPPPRRMVATDLVSLERSGAGEKSSGDCTLTAAAARPQRRGRDARLL